MKHVRLVLIMGATLFSSTIWANQMSDSDCWEMITNIHLDASRRIRAASSPDDATLIQYEYQAVPTKKLFEGACSSHPDANAYLAAADKMITESLHVINTAKITTPPVTTRPIDSSRSKVIASGENASNCVTAVTDQLGFGHFENNCGFDVEILACVLNPKQGSWAETLICKNQPGLGGGMVSARANNTSDAIHIKNAERVLWFACKKPAVPSEVRLASGGQMLVGLCR